MAEYDGIEVRPDDLPDDYRSVLDVCEDIVDQDTALRIVLGIGETFGGQSVYFQQVHKAIRPARARAIQAEFNGRNVRALARKHKISMRHCQELIKEGKSK